MIATLPESWTKLRYHSLQSAAYHSKKRFVNLAAGRGSGKTEISRRKIVRSLAIEKPWEPIYFYALPTIMQAKKVAWRPLLRLIPEHWLADVNVMDMRIETKFGSTLYVLGLDQPQRAEGLQYDGGVIDESSDVKPKVFDLSIRPALSSKRGWCYRIGVPKRYGVGAHEFKEWFDRGNDPLHKDIVSYTWPSSDILTQEEIESAKRTLDSRDFREQYEASWETAGGLIFYEFDNSYNIENVEYVPHKELIVGADFNVNPLAWVFGQRHGEELHVFDEFYIRNTNTKEALDEFNRRYGHHQAGVKFYVDASSRNRTTNTVVSDVVQIRNDKRIKKLKIIYPKKNPQVLDRFGMTNAALCNADGEHRVKISSKCKHLISDLRHRAYKEGTRIPDDSDPDSGHPTDALGYLIVYEYPLKIQTSSVPQYASTSF